MATRALLQYQSTNSTAESAAMVNATAEVAHNQSEAGYSLINYLAWSIPSLGFVGTVLGIGSALADFGISGASGPPLDRITANLGSAFDTTLVALLLSLVLMYIIHTVQAMEDRVINTAHEYCLANLVNRLFNPDQLTQ
jgi:biopolymer transport protein ExbB/TolQ